jgi:hypothetical protein
MDAATTSIAKELENWAESSSCGELPQEEIRAALFQLKNILENAQASTVSCFPLPLALHRTREPEMLCFNFRFSPRCLANPMPPWRSLCTCGTRGVRLSLFNPPHVWMLLEALC